MSYMLCINEERSDILTFFKLESDKNNLALFPAKNIKTSVFLSIQILLRYHIYVCMHDFWYMKHECWFQVSKWVCHYQKLQEQWRDTCLFVLINMIHCKQHFGEPRKNQIINIKMDIIWNVRIFGSFRSYDV